MTVQVRPTPARTWGNSIRPFQSVRPGPQLPTYTLKTWKPPVPEPLPPAPLLGLPSLLALGALLLSQAWGLFNRPRPGSATPDLIEYTGTGVYVINYRVIRKFEGTKCYTGEPYPNPSAPYFDSWQVGVPSNRATSLKILIDNSPVIASCLLSCETTKFINSLMVVYKTEAYSYEFENFVEFQSSPWCGQLEGRGVKEVSIMGVTLDGVELPLPFDPLPERSPWDYPWDVNDPTFPWITPEELAAIRPVPLPLPDAEPLADPLNPQPQTTPLTVPAPLVAPTVPLLQPLPAGVQLLPGGTLPTPQPAAVPQTPQGTHYPATGLAIPANPPAPTLQGIAQEVGRVESKLNKLLNPATGNNFDRLELIYDTISGLFEFLTSITAGGSYTLEAPCETAEDGSPLVVEHTYDGALNSIGVLSNKIDALAAMLQTVKNQKQPVCKAPPRQGQAVTVNFEEV